MISSYKLANLITRSLTPALCLCLIVAPLLSCSIKPEPPPIASMTYNANLFLHNEPPTQGANNFALARNHIITIDQTIRERVDFPLLILQQAHNSSSSKDGSSWIWEYAIETDDTLLNCSVVGTINKGDDLLRITVSGTLAGQEISALEWFRGRVDRAEKFNGVWHIRNPITRDDSLQIDWYLGSDSDHRVQFSFMNDDGSTGDWFRQTVSKPHYLTRHENISNRVSTEVIWSIDSDKKSGSITTTDNEIPVTLCWDQQLLDVDCSSIVEKLQQL